MKKKKIIISSNTAWSIYNFRRGIISELVRIGFEVFILAPNDNFKNKIELLGCTFINIEMSQRGVSPFQELKTFINYYRILKKINCDYYLGFTIKPNLERVWVLSILPSESQDL